jgi:hypothetical protein
MASLKESLLNNATLVFPNMQEPFIIRVDASHLGIGHALMQMHDSVEKVVAFGGRAIKWCQFKGNRFKITCDTSCH